MTKLILIDGHKFVRGKSRCLECDKPVKFTLAVELALVVNDTIILCKDCYWDDLDIDQGVKMTMRELIL